MYSRHFVRLLAVSEKLNSINVSVRLHSVDLARKKSALPTRKFVLKWFDCWRLTN